MFSLIPTIGKYLRFYVPPREAHSLAQGIVDFIRENRTKSGSDFATSTASFLQDYRSYTTESGKNFHWVGDMDGIKSQFVDIFTCGVVAFASFIRESEREDVVVDVDAFMLAFEPVRSGCGTCDGAGAYGHAR